MNSAADPRSDTLSARGIVTGLPEFLRRGDAWLDARGKWAWIAAMVAGFVIFFPLGLALLAWMIWGKHMFGFNCCNRDHAARGAGRFGAGRFAGRRSSGNSAFDNYRSETLRRLEEEQGAFEAFLQRLRDARDKQEFDHFMEERARDVTEPAEDAATATSMAGSETRRGAY